MTIVFLHDLATSRVPLQNAFILHAREEEVLLVIIGIEFDAKGDVASVEALFAFTCNHAI